MYHPIEWIYDSSEDFMGNITVFSCS